MSVASGRAGQGPGAARPRSGAGGVLEVTARAPDDGAAGNGSRFSGMRLSGPVPRYRGDPGAGSAAGCIHPFACPRPWPGGMGRVRVGAVRRGQSERRRARRVAGGRIACGLAPGGGAECLAASRPGHCPGRGWSCRPLARRGRGAVGGPGQAADLVVAHPVEDEGEQLAGGGDLGDVLCFLPAAGDDGVLALADRVAGRGPLDSLVSAQRSIRDPCLVTCPRATLRSDSRWRGVSPAHEHSSRRCGTG